MSDEIWRPIHGMESLYSVSDHGYVRRDAPGKGAKAGRVLKATIDGRGYRMVDLFAPAGRVKKKVHSLVAEHFIGARLEGTDIRHLDGDKAEQRRGHPCIRVAQREQPRPSDARHPSGGQQDALQAWSRVHPGQHPH